MLQSGFESIKGIFNYLGDLLGPVISKIQPQVGVFIALFAGIATKLSGPLLTVGKVLVSAFTGVMPVLTSVVGTASGIVGKFFCKTVNRRFASIRNS